LLNINFLKENWQYPHAGWENFGAKIFSKLLLGQCREVQHIFATSHEDDMLPFLPVKKKYSLAMALWKLCPRDTSAWSAFF
jgi:hypothetical protein